MSFNTPQLPNGGGRPSLSEMVPFLSRKISIWRSKILWLGVLLSIGTCALFGLIGDHGSVQTYLEIVSLLILLCIFVIVYMYFDGDKPIACYLIPSGFTYLVLSTHLQILFLYVFRVIPFGDLNLEGISDVSLPMRFVEYFVGAGLCEELIKAIVPLFALGLTLWLNGRPSPNTAWLQVRGPRDAMLLAFAAGCGFDYTETVFQYVPIVMKQNSEVGLFLLFPRIVATICGHAAYAGIFGYFIGLCVLRRDKIVQLLAIGWLTSATLHGIWDTFSDVTWVLYVSAVVSFVVFLAFALKARQLEADLGIGNSGGLAPGGGSIVAGAAPLGSLVVPSMAFFAPSKAPPPQSATPARANPASAAASPVAFELEVGACSIPLRPDVRVDLSKLPGLSHVRDIVFEVTRHPSQPDILGLRNLGSSSWSAEQRGVKSNVDPSRNLRIMKKTRINFGPVQGVIVETSSNHP